VQGIRRGGVAAIVAIAVAALPASAGAATYEVTTKGDPAPDACAPADCSLREAVIAANARLGEDKIVLPQKGGAYVLEIPSTDEDAALDGDLDITDPVQVVHPGTGTATIDAQGTDRVFDVAANAKTTFEALTIRNGSTVDMGGPRAPVGGGIRARSAIQVVASTIDASQALAGGGGIGLLGTQGALRMQDSQITGNVAALSGGGVDLGADTRLTMKRSLISGNVAFGGGGGVALATQEPASIERSTVAGNFARMGGGGIAIDEGTSRPFLRLGSSTVSGNNTAGNGGGIKDVRGLLFAVNSTIAENTATGAGGGLSAESANTVLRSVTVAFNVGDSTGAGDPSFAGGVRSLHSTVKVANTLIAQNSRGTGAANDCVGDFFTLGNNLVGTLGAVPNCDGFDARSDRIRVDPKLIRLRDNHGPTETVALKRGSAAIGHASRSTPKRDQRGRLRDKRPDIGAFEYR
jgi:hypothetical protein